MSKSPGSHTRPMDPIPWSIKRRRLGGLFGAGLRLGIIGLVGIWCLVVHVMLWLLVEVNLVQLLQPIIEQAAALSPEGFMAPVSAGSVGPLALASPRPPSAPRYPQESIMSAESNVEQLWAATSATSRASSGPRVPVNTVVRRRGGSRMLPLEEAVARVSYLMSQVSQLRGDRGALRVLNSLLEQKNIDNDTMRFIMENYVHTDDTGRLSSSRGGELATGGRRGLDRASAAGSGGS